MRVNKTLSLLLVTALALTISCKQTSTNATSTSAEKITQESEKTEDYSKIAYVNTDSIVTKYTMATELTDAFNIKAEKSEKQFKAKTNAFEKKVANFQNKVSKGLVTRTEAMNMQEQLKKEEQEVMVYGRKMESTLHEEQTVLMNKVSYGIKEYLKKYNVEHKYSLILNNNSMTTNVLASDPSLNITEEVLKGLNEDYKANKNKDNK
ncbi:MAG: OmpH family outer membrane protein [Bacteroidetes bacterium]|nr:OmpH family outer membrane protein [Bacteroidota bacterium]